MLIVNLLMYKITRVLHCITAKLSLRECTNSTRFFFITSLQLYCVMTTLRSEKAVKETKVN